MTVSTDYAPKTYNGNGVTTVFPVTWPFDDDEDVTVTHTTAAGVQTTWVQDGEGATGYTLEETEPGSGDWEVTANTAPDIGTTLTLSRSTPLTQEFDLENGRTYNVNTMEGHLDRMVMQNQEAYHAASLQDAENVESAIAIENAENVEAATNVVSATTVQDATTVTTASEVSGDIGTATTITQATGCTITNADTVNEFGGVTAAAADLNKVPGIVAGTQALDGLDVNGNADISGTANIHDTLTLSKASGTGLSVTSNAVIGGTLTLGGVLVSPDVGKVDFFAMDSAPAGFVKCNGAAISRSTYASLFSVIGTTFGVGDGSTTFNVPDLRGNFVRAWDDGRGVDSGRMFGSAQMDTIQNIIGTLSGIAWRTDGSGVVSDAFQKHFSGGASATTYDAYQNAYTSFDASRVVRTSAETRPRNVALLACIKY